MLEVLHHVLRTNTQQHHAHHNNTPSRFVKNLDQQVGSTSSIILRAWAIRSSEPPTHTPVTLPRPRVSTLSRANEKCSRRHVRHWNRPLLQGYLQSTIALPRGTEVKTTRAYIFYMHGIGQIQNRQVLAAYQVHFTTITGPILPYATVMPGTCVRMIYDGGFHAARRGGGGGELNAAHKAPGGI